jgi:hypothetical protein
VDPLGGPPISCRAPARRRWRAVVTELSERTARAQRTIADIVTRPHDRALLRRTTRSGHRTLCVRHIPASGKPSSTAWPSCETSPLAPRGHPRRVRTADARRPRVGLGDGPVGVHGDTLPPADVAASVSPAKRVPHPGSSPSPRSVGPPSTCAGRRGMRRPMRSHGEQSLGAWSCVQFSEKRPRLVSRYGGCICGRSITLTVFRPR